MLIFLTNFGSTLNSKFIGSETRTSHTNVFIISKQDGQWNMVAAFQKIDHKIYDTLYMNGIDQSRTAVVVT